MENTDSIDSQKNEMSYKVLTAAAMKRNVTEILPVYMA
jgi:hypothetical protein